MHSTVTWGALQWTAIMLATSKRKEDEWRVLTTTFMPQKGSLETWIICTLTLGYQAIKITVDCDYSHEIKRHLLLGRKAMTNLNSIWKKQRYKSRGITLPTKFHIVKAMVFPVVIYGCELDHKKLWCWRRLLRGPWTARRSNQSILKETNPEYSLEGLMLKLQ